jgi:hypothetical protein
MMKKYEVGIGRNGVLCLLLPLYAREHSDTELDSVDGFKIEVVATQDEPDAYIAIIDDEAMLLSPSAVEKHIEKMGPL